MKEIALFIAVLNVIFIGIHSYAIGNKLQLTGKLDRLHLFLAVIHGTAAFGFMLVNY